MSSVDRYINAEMIFHSDASFIKFQVTHDGFRPLFNLRLNKGSMSLSEYD